MKTLAFGVLLLLHMGGLSTRTKHMETREPAPGAPSSGGGGLEKGLQAPPRPPSKIFGSPGVESGPECLGEVAPVQAIFCAAAMTGGAVQKKRTDESKGTDALCQWSSAAVAVAHA